MATKKVLNHQGKYLTLILRHAPEQAGITLDSSGWAPIEPLLRATKLSLQELEEIVAADEKGRFEFSDDQAKIRASQGHSVDVDLGYESKDPPQFLYHGTSADNMPLINKNGLLKMERHDVHMFDNYDLALSIATKRRKNPIVIKIKSQDMVMAGYKFKLSTNNVWLTESVPQQFLAIA
jgi:putative RNA 2'-phosphotransferase